MYITFLMRFNLLTFDIGCQTIRPYYLVVSFQYNKTNISI